MILRDLLAYKAGAKMNIFVIMPFDSEFDSYMQNLFRSR